MGDTRIKRYPKAHQVLWCARECIRHISPGGRGFSTVMGGTTGEIPAISKVRVACERVLAVDLGDRVACSTLLPQSTSSPHAQSCASDPPSSLGAIPPKGTRKMGGLKAEMSIARCEQHVSGG